ncbi:serine O-acetyltransferase [Leeuwenhoekiella sp. W20_SRS_FM14]|uniref:serine O-acetyltransferase n=1 Tax=Leeuwenhoekiella sp. W20_SRS_FM14 TaxID=3240270 RepID=UPI003F979422
MLNNLFQDWKANKGNSKGRFVLLNFRLANLIRKRKLMFLFLFWYLPLYRLFIEWIMGVEINWNVELGRGAIVYHGQSLVIFANTSIGSNCTLRHSTTLGNKQLVNGGVTQGPKLGNNVDVGAHVCILGNIEIGNNVKIGAGSIVVKDIPDNCVVVGNPARIIRRN